MIDIELFALPDDTLTDISLVEYPAIESNWMCFSKDVKHYTFSDNEKHIITGAVLIPDIKIYRNDGGTEYNVFFSRETIRKISEQFFSDFKNKSFTLEHGTNTNDVVIVESWIKESDTDKSVALGINVPDGTWLISAKVNNPELWEQIKAGRFKGFSVAGTFSSTTTEDQILAEAEKFINDILNNEK